MSENRVLVYAGSEREVMLVASLQGIPFKHCIMVQEERDLVGRSKIPLWLFGSYSDNLWLDEVMSYAKTHNFTIVNKNQ